MLKILIAPSAFKGTLSPVKVAQAIEAGIDGSGLDCRFEVVPLADGGDGTLECLNFALGGSFEPVTCHGPTGVLHISHWLSLPDLAVVELASACGLALLQENPVKLNPLSANTLGLGEVLKDCIEKGEKNIVVTLGGSASTDGATGALHALGVRFLDKDNENLPPGGGYLYRLASIDLSPLQNLDLSLKVAVDVRNPLLGKNGAAQVFGPQKNASESDVEKLETGLTVLADVFERAVNKRIRNLPGTGAAGGTAFGLALGLNADIISGFHWFSQLFGLEEKIQWADLVITAEGKLDEQSLSGKASGELANLCKKFGKELIVIAATVENKHPWKDLGIQAIDLNGLSKQVTASDIEKVVSSTMKNYS